MSGRMPSENAKACSSENDQDTSSGICLTAYTVADATWNYDRASVSYTDRSICGNHNATYQTSRHERSSEVI